MGLLDVTATEPQHRAEHIVGPIDINHSNEQRTVASGQNLVAAHVVGAIEARSATSAAKAGGNTGNGTLTLDATTPVRTGAKAGVYRVRLITTATDGGTFRVEDPDGLVIGDVAVGATFDDDVKFATADGSTDFALGDGFDITVPAVGQGKLKEYNPANTDGSEKVHGVLWDAVDASAADAPGVATVRGPVNMVAANLKWFSGATTAQKAVALAELKALGIVAL